MDNRLPATDDAPELDVEDRPPGPHQYLKKLLFLLVKLVFTAGIFWILLSKIRFEDIWQRVAYLTVGDVLVLLVLLVFQLAIAVWRWRAIAGFVGFAASWLMTTRGILLERFINQALPSPVGGDAGRVWELVQAGASLKQGLHSVVLDRTLAIVGIAVTLFLTLPLALPLIESLEIRLTLVTIATSVVAGLLAISVLPGRYWTWLKILPAGKRACNLIELIRRLMNIPRLMVITLGISILVQLLVSVTIFVLAGQLHIDLSLAAALGLMPVIMVVTLMPISIAGWGVREGTMVFLLGFAGVASADAMAISILFGLINLAVAVVGGLVWLVIPRPPVGRPG